MPNDADRQAAAKLWEDCFATTFYHEQTAGSPHIAAIFIEAFEAHRLAAYQAGQRDMQERAAELADYKEAWVLSDDISALPIKETPDD